jgi:hypothetical protein
MPSWYLKVRKPLQTCPLSVLLMSTSRSAEWRFLALHGLPAIPNAIHSSSENAEHPPLISVAMGNLLRTPLVICSARSGVLGSAIDTRRGRVS